jgi:hypothetical protein
VIKTLAPTDRGAKALAQRYGERLICVRYRTDAKGKIRHTTVELLVSSAPIRAQERHWVHIRVKPQERAVHEMVKLAGGIWDPTSRLWKLPSRVASILRLRDRIIDP